MNKEIEDSLNNIFAAHEKKQEHAQTEKQRQETREDVFLKSFNEHVRTVIRPAFTAIGAYVESKGHAYKVDETADRTEADGRHHNATVAIHFFPHAESSGGDRPHEWPSFTVYCNERNEKVSFHQSTISPWRGGSAGSIGDASLSAVTPESIQKQLVTMLREVFK